MYVLLARHFLGFNDEISAQFDLGTLSSMYFAQLSHKWNLILQKIQLSLLSTSTAIGKRIIGFFLPISSKKCLDHFSISKEPRTILMKKNKTEKPFGLKGCTSKLRTFWETHKIWKNLPHGLDKSADLLSKRQNHEDDGANFCGLLRKYEILIKFYYILWNFM